MGDNNRGKVTSFRWVELVVGTIVLLVLGSLYAWSTYRGTLVEEFNWSTSSAQLTFSISMMTFCLGGLTSGIVSKKTGPRIILFFSAILMFAGLFTASRIESLMGLYVSYGILYGFGVGMGYNAIMGTIIRWFPDKTGFASGILLFGFGISSLLVGFVAARMIKLVGWRTTFMVFGLVFGAIVLILSFLVKLPKDEELRGIRSGGTKSVESYSESTAGVMIKSKNFWLFFIWAISLSSAGLVIVGNSTPFADSILNNLELAAIIAGVISVCNGLGRIIFGSLFDIMGYKVTMLSVIALFILATIVLLCANATGKFAVLVIAYIAVGFAYGGVTPTISAFAAKFFGQKNYAMNLSVINMNLLVSSYLPQVATILLDKNGEYNGMFYYMIILAAVGFVMTLLISKPKKI